MSRITRRSIIPVNQVTPLTYRDGVTYIQMLSELSEYIKSILHPSLQHTVDQLVADVETQMDKHHDQYVDGVQEFQRIHDAFISDVNASLIALNDTAVSDLVDDTTSNLSIRLRQLFSTTQDHDNLVDDVLSRSVTPQDFGAVPDWDNVSGTDNAQAFQDAIDAAGDGGTVYVPPGQYYLSKSLKILYSITFTTGGGGSATSGYAPGTRLVFAEGVNGLEIGVNVDGVEYRPSFWKIGPLNIESLAREAGQGVGLLIRAGRGQLEQTNVESFGSHGFHVLGGRNYGGGNANTSIFNLVRAYGNYGDGIRLEGSDANNSLLLKPDVTANNGYGINLEMCAMNKIILPHADQSYRDSPGAFRDNGTSNNWDWVYSEGGVPFIIGKDSNHGVLSMSVYAKPRVISEGFGHVSWQVNGLANTANHFLRVADLDGENLFSFRTSKHTKGSFELTRGGYTSETIFSVHPNNTMQYFVGINPRTANTLSLGERHHRWDAVFANTLFASDEIQLGSMKLRNRDSSLEVSTNNGVTWQRVVTE